MSRRTPPSALGVLRETGLITATQNREHGGRFGATVYLLTVDASVLGHHTRVPLAPSRPIPDAQLGVTAKPVVAVGEQLVLLPSA